jgi:Ca2+-binding RTX toxin-like protein
MVPPTYRRFAQARAHSAAPRLTFRSAGRAAAAVAGVALFVGAPQVASATTIVGTPSHDHLVATAPTGDTLYGGGGADTLTGGPGNDVIYGVRSGNTIDGRAGNNYIEGGTGDDKITAGNGANTVYGGSGDDTIKLGDGNNYVDPGGSADKVTLGNGNNVIAAGAGGLILHAGNGNNTVYYRSGPDEIDLGTGVNTVYVGTVGAFAKIDCGGNPQSVVYVSRSVDPTLAIFKSAQAEGKVVGCPTIASFDGPAVPISITAPVGTNPFTLIGTDGVDKLYGRHGGGTIDGKGGNNVLWADREHDTGGAFAQSKTTTITAGDGDNLIYGGRGTNYIGVGNGRNFIRGGALNNYVTVGSGNNVIRLQGKGKNIVTINGGASYVEAFVTGKTKPHITCNSDAQAIVVYGVRKPVTNCPTVANAKTRKGAKLQVQGVDHIVDSDPIVSFPLVPGQNGVGIARPSISASGV